MAREVKISIRMSGAKEATGEVREIKNVFDQLDESASRDIKHVQQTLNSLGNVNISGIANQIQNIRETTDAIDDKQVRELQDSLNEVGTEAQQAASVYRDAAGRLRDENGKFIKSADDAAQAADNLGNSVENAAQQFDKLKDAGATVKNFGNTIQGVGQSLTVGLTLPIVGLGAAVATVGIGYEQALNSFQAVTKATSEEMAQASKVAKELGADVTLPATSAKDAALAMEELGKAGLNANQSMAAAKGVLQLAAAGQLEEAKAAEITANALNSFSLKAEEATRVADLLAAAANASSAGVGDIAEALAQSSASFAAAKVPIEDLTSAIGLLANAGIKGSDAGTSLKTFLSSIQAPADGGATAMEKLGIKVFDAAGKFKGLPTVIGDFEKALSGLTDEEKVQSIQKIFGSDASRAAQILFKEGAAGFEKMKGAVTQAGAAADLAASKTKGVGGAFESLKSQAETIGITIYDAVKGPAEEGLRSLGETLGNVSDYLSNLAQNNPQLIQMGVVFLGIVAAVGPLLVVLGTLIVGIGSVITAIGTIGAAWATVSAAVTVAGGVFAALGTVITGTILPALAAIAPVVLTVAAVLAAIGIAAFALYEAWSTNFGNIQGVVSLMVDEVSGIFSGMLAVIQPAIDAVSAYVIEGFAKISEWWATEGGAISDAAGQVFLAILSVVKGAVDSIKGFWADHGAWITSFTMEVWDGIKVAIGGAMQFISGIIKVVTGVINGDWGKVWSGLGDIANGALHAVAGVIKAGLVLVVGAVGAILAGVWELGRFILTQAYNLGEMLITGLINGIVAGVGAVARAAWDLGKRAINAIGEAVDAHSPSREAEKIGQFVGDGLANGIESKTEKVKKAAKKLGDETIKQLREAVKEFEKLAGASPQQVGRIQQADTIKNATGNQSEIIKLRGELGVNQYRNLPTTVSGTDRELKDLQAKKKAQDAFNKSMEELAGIHKEVQELEEAGKKAFEDKIKTIKESGAMELLKLQQEIDLTGVIDEKERQRITNLYEIKNLREQMYSDGYGQQQIDEAAEVLRLEQAKRQELEYILNIRKQVAGATGLGAGLSEKLSGLQNGNRELSEYEKTLAKIDKDYKNISPAQRESLLNTAKQVDAQKAYNEQYKQTYDFIRGSLDILTDSSKSFGDKMKSIFGGIADRFKKMLLDMTAQWLTSKIFGNSSAGGGSGGAAAGGGGIFDAIKNLSGGGSASIGGGGLPGSGSGGTAFGFSGGSGSGNGTRTGDVVNGVSQVFGGDKGRGDILSNIKNLFSNKEGGMFAPVGGSSMAGYASGAGSIAQIAGGLIGGRWGNTLSMAGTGAQIGAMFGPWGALIGAGAGALLGFFGYNDPKRKQDKKENLPKLQQGFTEALQQLRDLSANKNAILSDPGGAIAKATELRSQIAGGFGIQFLSKKYRKQAQSQIASKVTEADSIIAGIKEFAKKAYSAKELEGRIVGEFAGGVYMDSAFAAQYGDFKRRNGMMPGAFTGRDTLPSMIATGEMVLNPRQIANVIHAVGEDPFPYAGIPNYPSKPKPIKGYADGNYFGTGAPSFSGGSSSARPSSDGDKPIYLTVNLFKDDQGNWKQEAESDGGRKVIANIVEKKFANGELKFQKR